MHMVPILDDIRLSFLLCTSHVFVLGIPSFEVIGTDLRGVVMGTSLGGHNDADGWWKQRSSRITGDTGAMRGSLGSETTLARHTSMAARMVQVFSPEWRARLGSIRRPRVRRAEAEPSAIEIRCQGVNELFECAVEKYGPGAAQVHPAAEKSWAVHMPGESTLIIPVRVPKVTSKNFESTDLDGAVDRQKYSYITMRDDERKRQGAMWHSFNAFCRLNDPNEIPMMVVHTGYSAEPAGLWCWTAMRTQSSVTMMIDITGKTWLSKAELNQESHAKAGTVRGGLE
ncbi:hypothetical protein EV421DRAFT_1744208 [Armillaria borealis]|uniref:Uncharacterized protein n=1 Tax=Armillaria borealis TaxID=47425 RepID=A0AA39IV35_9AGAR|nr:hypothetical protein EV421DRAFT_1744208 [Armillaria borealis]